MRIVILSVLFWANLFQRVNSLSYQCVSKHQSCINTDTTRCHDPEGEYNNKSTTIDGVECEVWNGTSPHNTSNWNYPKWGHNYCRNPDDHNGPWCFTTDPNKMAELCFADCCTPTSPRDCGEIKESSPSVPSGVYTIRLRDTSSDCDSSGGFVGNGICCAEVYCDMDTFGGGWMVFQKRFDGSQEFYLNFANYSVGFGRLDGEFWAGNQLLYYFAQRKTYELLIELHQTESNCSLYAEYASFSISSFIYYTSSIGNYIRGTAGDSLYNYHNGSPFSTYDIDNDADSYSCASTYHGAWWYYSCHWSNLNGKYVAGCSNEYATGISWRTARGYYYSFGGTEMKIRPTDYSLETATPDAKFCADSAFNPCPHDCSWNQWGNWGSCQLADPCDQTGTSTRSRTQNPGSGGMACLGSNTDSKPCDGNGCSADLPSVIELEAHCNNIQGVMVGSSCFILSVESRGWTDHWTACTQQATTISHSEPWKYKGRLGHLYSTDILSRVGKYLNTSTTPAILSTGLAIGVMKMDPAAPTTQENIFWMGTAGQRFEKSMRAYLIDESMIESPDMTDQCFLLKLVGGGSWMLATTPCSISPSSRLCEIVAPAQQYILKHGKQKMVYPIGFPDETTESDVWECGLACRKAQGCLSFNYQESTGFCEMFGVKYADVLASANITIDESFNYYERFF